MPCSFGLLPNPRWGTCAQSNGLLEVTVVVRWIPFVTAAYVDDVRTAMTEAKRAAGDKNVLVHGAAVAQLALAADVLDELEIHLVPVLLGQGRRLFDHLGPEHIELERTRILEGEADVTHLHYRVQR
jgi:dihydrofolate reductase